MKKKIKLTKKEEELIETIRTFKALKNRRFIDLELYVWQLLEELLYNED